MSLNFNNLVVTTGHTYLNKPAALTAGLFKYVWPFVTTKHERVKAMSHCFRWSATVL